MGYIVSTDLVIAKGYQRSIIYDLTREDYEYIPNDLADVLIEGTNLEKIEQTKITWLLEKEYIIDLPNEIRENLPALDLSWDYPSGILNLTLSSDVLHTKSEFIVEMVQFFNIQSVALIDVNLSSRVRPFLEALELTSVQVVEWLTNYTKKYNYSQFTNSYHKLKSIVIYDSPKEETFFGDDGFGNLVKKTTKFSERELFRQHPSYFNVNMELVSESQTFNTYFNRRLHISNDGTVSQTMYSKESFGNIGQFEEVREIKALIDDDHFQKHWKVTKDQIDICRDCEHRFMCVDNREPQKRRKNEWYHLTECNYNPYIAKWDMEDSFISTFNCGVRSNHAEFSADHEVIKKSMKKAWK